MHRRATREENGAIVTDEQAVKPATEIAKDVDARRMVILIVGVVALVGFVVIRLVVALGGHEPLPMDVWWHEFVLATLNDVGILIAWIPAHVGGTIGMIVIGFVIVAAFWWRRRRWDAAHVAIAMVIVVAIGAPMSYIVARTRPEGSLAEDTATSFPSGHTAVATTVAITLALILRRWYVWVLGAGWVVLMMWSRTYLQAHWLSDVIAGLLEGIAVACLVWCAIEAVRDRRALRKAEESASPSASPSAEAS
jgi:membrane-associated phospholipid phosphatase